MFSAFIEVLKDLWLFATKKALSQNTVTLLPAVATTASVDSQQQTSKAPAGTHASPQLQSPLCYVQTKRLLCLQTPQKKFDTLRGVMNYGDVVRVIEQKNAWSFVENTHLQGWVETRHLSPEATTVFPDLQSGQSYSAQNPETAKLRLYMNDSQLAAELQLDLQSSEYIMYRLQRQGQKISWPLERPRLAGSWRRILQSKQGIVISTEPKTGAVLEGVSSAGSFLAYVESVTPASEMEITSVGRLVAGEYEKLRCSPAQWQQWQPVFIAFT